ncbi:MAG: TRAP transporter small permease [Desulfopila sp.]
MTRLIDIIHKTEELFIGYALLGIAVIATIQVILRYTMGLAYDWVDEGSRYMTVLITFMGAGICVRYGSHFSMDAVIQYVPNRLKHLFRMVAHLVSAATMVVVCYAAWIQIGKLAKYGATTPSFKMPMYIPYLPIGIFTAVIALRFLIKAGENAGGLLTNTAFENSEKEEHSR